MRNLIFLFCLMFFLVLTQSFVSSLDGFGYDNPNLPKLNTPAPTGGTTVNNNTLNVNNSQFLQGYTPFNLCTANNSYCSTHNATYGNLLNQACPAGKVVNGTLANGTFICTTVSTTNNLTGWGVNEQVAYWNGTDLLKGDKNMTWSSITKQLSLYGKTVSTSMCEGTATTCDMFGDESSCNAQGGCSASISQCSDYDNTDETTCQDAFEGGVCTWEDPSCTGSQFSSCDGTPNACSTFSVAACTGQAGCSVGATVTLDTPLNLTGSARLKTATGNYPPNAVLFTDSTGKIIHNSTQLYYNPSLKQLAVYNPDYAGPTFNITGYTRSDTGALSVYNHLGKLLFQVSDGQEDVTNAVFNFYGSKDSGGNNGLSAEISGWHTSYATADKRTSIIKMGKRTSSATSGGVIGYQLRQDGSLSFITPYSAQAVGAATRTEFATSLFGTTRPYAVTFNTENTTEGNTLYTSVANKVAPFQTFWNSSSATHATFDKNFNFNSTGNLSFDVVKVNTVRVTNATNNGMDRCTLVSGVCKISNIKVTAQTRIFCTVFTEGGTLGNHPHSNVRQAGNHYNITTNQALDTSVVDCMLVEPQ